MGVEESLNQTIEKKGAVHLTLIDPDSQEPEEAGKIAKEASGAGTDAIMVGGSSGATGVTVEKTVRSIKSMCDLPVILFPANASALCEGADAVFFMSLLNSRDVNYITTHQAIGAPLVYKYGIEPISMAYIVIEPGGAAGWVGDARLIPRNKPKLAVAYALAAKYLGMHCIYLEAGSGADKPVPVEMVAAVKKAIGRETRLIVGGGIRDGATAKERVKAGADMIVTGTVVEQVQDIRGKIEELVRAIKS
ncbi:MAG: geranylgeranylglyceryl/heptaprenylglyceryl phosphate synthase [Candidatus Methanoperedens sp.]|nr:geranylgeranylglyceryl/heptaprenylglyceryl phosphate synthase [Candidatus Methanoperedens sp.]MCZ7359585.1 geranylgeranylglyceryl/heptaprenylglyceryl phosphate synthase [Candidatus Methanoperedens sp.]HLB72238.1 geranylgeranylglyceryl/heptaprenylglyceryl phosphate synthase [Candidatus Methanoperedens sp.]